MVKDEGRRPRQAAIPADVSRVPVARAGGGGGRWFRKSLRKIWEAVNSQPESFFLSKLTRLRDFADTQSTTKSDKSYRRGPSTTYVMADHARRRRTSASTLGSVAQCRGRGPGGRIELRQCCTGALPASLSQAHTHTFSIVYSTVFPLTLNMPGASSSATTGSLFVSPFALRQVPVARRECPP